MKHEELAKRLQIALNNANISQQELADKSGVAKASISHYINGSHKPSNISSGKIGKVLNVNPLWLMGFDVDMNERITADQTATDNELQEIIEIYKTIDTDRESFIKYLMLAKKIDELPEDKREAVVNIINFINKEE